MSKIGTKFQVNYRINYQVGSEKRLSIVQMVLPVWVAKDTHLHPLTEREGGREHIVISYS